MVKFPEISNVVIYSNSESVTKITYENRNMNFNEAQERFIEFRKEIRGEYIIPYKSYITTSYSADESFSERDALGFRRIVSLIGGWIEGFREQGLKLLSTNSSTSSIA
jgi:hypothetical protein